jgi:hypothetical protein
MAAGSRGPNWYPYVNLRFRPDHVANVRTVGVFYESWKGLIA